MVKTAQVIISYKSVTNNPASIPANSTADISLSVAKALPEHFPVVKAPDLEAGLILGQAWCEVAGTVKVRLANVTSAPIDAASQAFEVLIR